MDSAESRRHRQLMDVLAEALDRPAAERAVYVAHTCAGDEDLARAVERLLAHDAALDAFLEHAPASLVTRFRRRLPERV